MMGSLSMALFKDANTLCTMMAESLDALQLKKTS